MSALAIASGRNLLTPRGQPRGCTLTGVPESSGMAPTCPSRPASIHWVYWTATVPAKQHMLLTIRTTHQPATDLGFLLHKHPEHVHTREFPFGNATVFYPEATEEACTAAVLLDVDPVGMVRGRGGKGGAEDQYVNDRPYVASSLLSVVLSRWFNSALGGSMRAETRAGGRRAAARSTTRGRSLPWRRSVPPRVVRASRLRGRSDPPRTRREHAGARPEPAVHRHAASNAPLERPADAPVRARSGPRRSEALLGWRRRGREAASSRGGLARQPSVARRRSSRAIWCISEGSFATPSPG